ncbi:MAG: MBL fold metallo-hydrolase [Patescibacteria group bacterium]|nr:MBL fold metallo-hydrolase [Patescibacteria group bacterium]MDE1966047.1 MBL fold metallo-hydrolase [Patescibacteria group bacterium]
MRPRLPLAVLGLLAANVFVWHAVLAPRALTVSVLDIGQGDSILVEGPTGVRMLVDGGPDRSVLRELGAVMPFGDARIDAVVETHPDKDHIGGLADVFARYDVANFLEPGIGSDTNAVAALRAATDREPGMRRIVARRGMRLNLGGGAYADILYPDRDVSSIDTNSGSVTMHVAYGATSFMLTGDLPIPVEEWLTHLDAKDGELPTTVLKAGHHGSRFSTGDDWLAALHPKTVAISVGAGNMYGHPTAEMLARVANEGATVYRTDKDGRLTFVSDGVTVRKR